MLPGFIGNFNQSTEQVVIHEPVIREVAAFRFLTFENISEKVIEQLVSHFIA